jgi:hypothetical protein
MMQVDLSKVQVPNFDLSKLPPPPSVEQLIAALNALQNGDIIGEYKTHVFLYLSFCSTCTRMCLNHCGKKTCAIKRWLHLLVWLV